MIFDKRSVRRANFGGDGEMVTRQYVEEAELAKSGSGKHYSGGSGFVASDLFGLAFVITSILTLILGFINLAILPWASSGLMPSAQAWTAVALIVPLVFWAWLVRVTANDAGPGWRNIFSLALCIALSFAFAFLAGVGPEGYPLGEVFAYSDYIRAVPWLHLALLISAFGVPALFQHLDDTNVLRFGN